MPQNHARKSCLYDKLEDYFSKLENIFRDVSFTFIYYGRGGGNGGVATWNLKILPPEGGRNLRCKLYETGLPTQLPIFVCLHF